MLGEWKVRAVRSSEGDGVELIRINYSRISLLDPKDTSAGSSETKTG